MALPSAECAKRMTELIDILKELSERQLSLFEEVEGYLDRLDLLYQDDFRHSYSEIAEFVRRLA